MRLHDAGGKVLVETEEDAVRGDLADGSEEILTVPEEDARVRAGRGDRAPTHGFVLDGRTTLDPEHVRIARDDDREIPARLRAVENEAVPRMQLIERAEDQNFHLVLRSIAYTRFSSRT